MKKLSLRGVDNRYLLGGHHGDELFVVDLAIPINVCLADHLVHLLVSQFLPQVGHHLSQLRSAYEAIAVLVEHPEGFWA